MHELLLFGQVPLARHEQVLKILAGLAAMQPFSYHERRMILQNLRGAEQSKPSIKTGSNKPVQASPQVYTQLIQKLCPTDFSKEILVTKLDSKLSPQQDGTSPTWISRTQDIPEPEMKTITIRKVTEDDISPDAVESYLDLERYGFLAEFVLEGHRLICRDIILSLYRVLKLPPQAEGQSNRPTTTLPALEQLGLLDASGAFVLEACVRVEDRTKPSLVQTASEELNWLRKEMKGVVDLRAAERLALDTRVKQRPSG